jgi:hypothetical protein
MKLPDFLSERFGIVKLKPGQFIGEVEETPDGVDINIPHAVVTELRKYESFSLGCGCRHLIVRNKLEKPNSFAYR